MQVASYCVQSALDFVAVDLFFTIRWDAIPCRIFHVFRAAW